MGSACGALVFMISVAVDEFLKVISDNLYHSFFYFGPGYFFIEHNRRFRLLRFKRGMGKQVQVNRKAMAHLQRQCRAANQKIVGKKGVLHQRF